MRSALRAAKRLAGGGRSSDRSGRTLLQARMHHFVLRSASSLRETDNSSADSSTFSRKGSGRIERIADKVLVQVSELGANWLVVGLVVCKVDLGQTFAGAHYKAVEVAATVV